MRTQTANPRISISFIDNLYKSHDALDETRIRNDILAGKKHLHIYLIVESEKDGEMFVIYRASELLLPIYNESHIKVIGLAKSRRSALSLLGEILIDMKIDKEHYNGNSFTYS